jgi:fatty acid desaturase
MHQAVFNSMKVFENRVLRRIFVLKMDDEIGGWRKLHNKEHHNLYSSPQQYERSSQGG